MQLKLKTREILLSEGNFRHPGLAQGSAISVDGIDA